MTGFGEEWTTFDQTRLADGERDAIANQYFAVFPWAKLSPDAEGFDLGCGSGRWASWVAPRVGRLHCIDASEEALAVARRRLADRRNVTFHHTSVGSLDLPEASLDFGYSLGVLHHVPDPQAGIAACVRLLKPGAPLLVYLYYAFDNRPGWYRALWQVSDAGRRVLSRCPHPVKRAVSAVIALTVYVPLARTAHLARRLGRARAADMPLAYYAERSLYTMRTDAYDRFGTRLEQRFTREELEMMMRRAGLQDIVFSDGLPYWCAVGYREGKG